MEHHFWHARWAKGQIGFHQSEVNEYLQNHWSDLGFDNGGRVFVPLCGKSLDMLWLREQGHPVLGVELSSLAVEAFFAENRLPVQRETEGCFERFSAEGIDLYCGDFFALSEEQLGDCRLVYDRASLIALPPSMRGDYAAKFARLLQPGTQVLLITMDYPQEQMSGPPFSVSEAEVKQLFGDNFEVELRASFDIPAKGHLAERGITGWQEKLYFMRRKED